MVTPAADIPVIKPLSPSRPISATIAAAIGGTPNYASYAGGKGFIIQSIVGNDGSTPLQVMIGFNKQQPSLFLVRDAFIATHPFQSIEIYNPTLTVWNVKANVFDGTYVPSSSSTTQSITNVSAGLFSPLASSPATLKGVPTVGLAPMTIIEYVDSTTTQLTSYQLRSDPAGTPAAGKVVPNDYNIITNPFSWYSVL